MAQNDGSYVRRGRSVRVAVARLRPQRRAQSRQVLSDGRHGTLKRSELNGRDAVNEAGVTALTVQSGGHRKQLPKGDIGLRRVIQRQSFRQVLVVEDLG